MGRWYIMVITYTPIYTGIMVQVPVYGYYNIYMGRWYGLYWLSL